MILAQATETAGLGAIVTAAGGVAVSLTTVWLNSRRQGAAAGEMQAEVTRLRDEVDRLSRQLQSAEEARIERDRLMDLMQAYGGRKLRKRLVDVDLGRRV